MPGRRKSAANAAAPNVLPQSNVLLDNPVPGGSCPADPGQSAVFPTEVVPSNGVDLLNPDARTAPQPTRPARKPRARKPKAPEPVIDSLPTPVSDTLPTVVREELQNSMQEFQRFRDQLRAFQEEFQAARSELTEIRNHSSLLQQEVQQTETTVRDLRQAASDTLAELRTQSEAARQSLVAFQRDCDQTSQEMHTLRTGLTALPVAVVEQELQGARKELEELEARSRALEEEFTTAEQTSRAFQNSLKTATDEVRIGSEQGRTLQEKVVQTEGSLREFQQSLKTMRDELHSQSEDAHATLLTLQQDCLTIERQIGEVRNDLEALRPPRLDPAPVPTPAPAALPRDSGPILETQVREVAVESPPPLPAEQTVEPVPGPDDPENGKPQLGITVDQDAVVVAVLPETPAEKAGLQPGDVVLGVDDRPVASSQDLQSAIQQAEPGQEVRLTVARGTDTEEVKTQLAEPPPQGS